MIYELFAKRMESKFRIYAAAVAGERALAAAAGLPPGSLKQWSRADAFKAGLIDDVLLEAEIYIKQELTHPSNEFTARATSRLDNLVVQARDAANQITKQTNRQATFGSANPTNALNRPAGKAIGELVQRRLASPEFKIKDTAGRSWNADQLIHTLARDFAYQTFIDSQFNEAVNAGAKSVTLEHPAQDHPLVDSTIDLTANDWMAKRDATFHINSNLSITYGPV